eukprot:gb/GECH01006537.1/.p1 GENE.gb/GECH01006537.1/~~gb/GECH01006537.1/.p1  ORF type:complete len:318 (+),score=46.30 gb/GECH01006537.1/:1-954(+)
MKQETTLKENKTGESAPSSISRNLLAGALARCTAATILFPVDVIKTRFQFMRGNNTLVAKPYSSILGAFSTIYRSEGLIGFYRGLPVKLFYVAPAAAVSFTVYEQFKSAMKKLTSDDADKSELPFGYFTPVVTVMAGAGARVLGTACRTPFDMLKQHLQVQGISDQSTRGTMHILKTIFRSEGLRGLFIGYKVTLLRDAPFAAIYFTTYEMFKVAQQRVFGISESSMPNHLAAGASAGFISTCCTIPVDVVKTRLQTQYHLPASEQRYSGIIDVFQRLWKEEGVRGLSRGLGPRLVYLIPSASITFAAFEQFKKFIR